MPAPLPSQPTKKRHHYVPVSYLARFTDPEGFLYAYRKDEPDKVLRSKPESIGFQKYYYSQPLPDGGYDHNQLESGLGEMEAGWTDLAARLAAGANVNNQEDLGYLLGYMALQKVRVPAARDLAEKALAHRVMQQLRQLDAAGELDPNPEGLEKLLDLVQITIDPDSSVYEIIHNQTATSFITSDNPVAYFDPSIPEKAVQPYHVVRPQRPMELLFPVDPRTMVRGHSDYRERFARKGLKHVTLRDEDEVRRLNRFTARFGYELLISCDTTHGALVRAYAGMSPVLQDRKLPLRRACTR
jgi:hypothetical protein